MRPARPALAAWIIGLTAAAGSAQDPAPAPAPAGEIPGAFRSFIASDQRYPADNARNRQEKMHCLVCEAGLNPVVAVFARTDPTVLTPDSPLGQLVQKLGAPASDGDKGAGGFVARKRAENAAAFVIFLTLDKPFPELEAVIGIKPQGSDAYQLNFAQMQALQKAAGELNAPGVPLGLAEKQSPATAAWKLDPAAEVTVIVYNRLAVVRRWAFGPTNPLTDAAVDEIVRLADETAGGKK